MWSQNINIQISSLLLWPIDLLLSDALLYFYDNKRILILILILISLLIPHSISLLIIVHVASIPVS